MDVLSLKKSVSRNVKSTSQKHNHDKLFEGMENLEIKLDRIAELFKQQEKSKIQVNDNKQQRKRKEQQIQNVSQNGFPEYQIKVNKDDYSKKQIAKNNEPQKNHNTSQNNDEAVNPELSKPKEEQRNEQQQITDVYNFEKEQRQELLNKINNKQASLKQQIYDYETLNNKLNDQKRIQDQELIIKQLKLQIEELQQTMNFQTNQMQLQEQILQKQNAEMIEQKNKIFENPDDIDIDNSLHEEYNTRNKNSQIGDLDLIDYDESFSHSDMEINNEIQEELRFRINHRNPKKVQIQDNKDLSEHTSDNRVQEKISSKQLDDSINQRSLSPGLHNFLSKNIIQINDHQKVPEMNQLWEKALSYIRKNDYESAYRHILDSGKVICMINLEDDIYLIRLMIKTQPCVQHFSKYTLSQFVKKLNQLYGSNFKERLFLGILKQSLECKILNAFTIEDHQDFKNIINLIAQQGDNISDICHDIIEQLDQFPQRP